MRSVWRLSRRRSSFASRLASWTQPSAPWMPGVVRVAPILWNRCSRTARAALNTDVPLLLLLSGLFASAVGRLALTHHRPANAEKATLPKADAAAEDAVASEITATRPRSLDEVYELGDVIGHGHFATVRRGIHKETGVEVAIKHIATTSDASAIRQEIEIMRRIGSHRNIVKLCDVFETEQGWFLVLELVTGGELFERLVRQGAYSEKEASALFGQIGGAIQYLHSQDLCHRDLKPENLLLSSAQNDAVDAVTVKICDFGLSVALEDGATLRDRQGTWAYWAPEMFSGSGYGKEVDMWSLGVILYIILSGRHPFDAPGRTDAQMRQCIQDGQFGFDHEAWEHVSKEAKELIRALLQHDPKRRLSADALLRHPWVVGTGVSEQPIADSSSNLHEYQQMRKKWRAAIIASLHRSTMMRKRYSDKGKGFKDVGGTEQLDVGELLADAFQMFDPEGKGYVLSADLENVIARLGQRVTPDELQQMVRAMDRNRTGKIHYQEYLNMASATVKEQSQRFPAGTVIFREGDPSDYFYLITSGRVRKLTKPPQGYAHSQWVAKDEELAAGDYFGTSAILGSGRRHSTMVAVTDVEVMMLGREDFLESSPDSPQVEAGAQMPRRRSSASSLASRVLSPERSIRFINMMSLNEPRMCRKGETIFRQGDEGNHMYIIKSGRVQVSVVGKDGRRHIVGERGRGECCGETACLSSNPRNCTVTCVSGEGCEVLAVSRDDFLELVRGSWDVRHDLIAVSERNSKEKQRRLNFLRTREEVHNDDDD